jgi:hypothetical protein
MVIRRVLVLVARAFCSIAISHSAAGATVGKVSQNDSAVSLTMAMPHDGAGTTNDGKSIRDISVVEQLPDDDPIGAGAIITAVSIRRAKNLNDATLSTFLVDYPPGASAVLHRMPAPGVCAGSRAIGDDPCICLERRRRHLSHRRDVGGACFRRQHCDCKFERSTTGSSTRHSRYRRSGNANEPVQPDRIRHRCVNS